MVVYCGCSEYRRLENPSVIVKITLMNVALQVINSKLGKQTLEDLKVGQRNVSYKDLDLRVIHFCRDLSLGPACHFKVIGIGLIFAFFVEKHFLFFLGHRTLTFMSPFWYGLLCKILTLEDCYPNGKLRSVFYFYLLGELVPYKPERNKFLIALY